MTTPTTNKYNNVKAYFIARVSDESQKDALPAQRMRLEAYRDENGLVGEIFEFDETAFASEKRKQFAEIIHQIEKEKDFCVVVFDKIDRFTRDCSSELVRVMKDLVKQGRIELHFVSEGPFIYHKDSPATDKTRLDMGMVFGSYYSNAISDAVKRRQEQKVADGEYPGPAPYGYKNIIVGYAARHKKITEIVVDEKQAEYVRMAYDLRLEGKSVGTITKMLNAAGATTKKGKPFACSRVDSILKDKFYAGIMRWRGKEYTHKYPLVISKQTYDAAQDMNKERSHNKVQTERQKEAEPFTYSGILRCQKCGGAMSPYIRKGHIYLRCSKSKEECGNCNVSEDEINQQITEVISRITIDEATCEQIAEEISSENEVRRKSLARQQQAVRDELNRLKRQLSTIYEDRLDGRITVEKYDEIVESKEKRINGLENALEALVEHDKDISVDATYLLKLAQRLPELFKSSRSGLKNEILNCIFSNLQIWQKTTVFALHDPYETFYSHLTKKSDGADYPDWLPGLDSNQ